MTECEVCKEVRDIYGTTDSVAPWLCSCPGKHNFNPQRISRQENIYGCFCPIRTLKKTRRQIHYCDC